MKSIEELFSLKGRVAIVTGASRGLGKEAAEGLAEAGARIVLAARREQWLGPTAEEFRKRGFDCLACICDVADDVQVRELVSKTIEHFGRIDILVNNAAVRAEQAFEGMTLAGEAGAGAGHLPRLFRNTYRSHRDSPEEGDPG